MTTIHYTRVMCKAGPAVRKMILNCFTGAIIALLPLICCGQTDGMGNRSFANMVRGYTREDSLQFAALYLKSSEVLDMNPDSALVLLYKALAGCRQSGYDYGTAKCIMGISHAYFGKGEIEKALTLLNKQGSFIHNIQSPKLDIEYYIKKGIYNEKGGVDTAMKCYFKALYIVEQHLYLDTSGFFRYTIYEHLGSLFMAKKADIPIAIRYFRLAEQVALEKGKKDWLSGIYVGLGGTYANSNLTDTGTQTYYREGLRYLYKALELGQETGRWGNVMNAYNNIAAIYVNLKQPDSAEHFVQKAMQLSVQFQRKSQDIRSLMALGAAFINKKAYAKAETYLFQARQYSIDMRARIDLCEIDKTLYLLYLYTRDYDKALAHLQAYTFLRDSLIDEEKIKTISNLEIKYRSAEKDKEIVLKNLKLSNQQSQLREKNVWIGAGIASSISLSGFLFVLYRNSRHRRRRQEEQQQLWQQGEEIRNLKATISGEERERARIGRELHDGVVGQLVATKMNFNMIQNKYPIPRLREDFKEALAYLDETAQELRKMAHNLMPGILIEHGLVTAVDAFCEKTSTFTGIRIDVHQDGFVPRLDIDFELSVYRMIQELVQNIVKHANATRALVQLDYHEPMLILTVEDNGIGIAAPEMPGEKGAGTGLVNLKTRIKALQGSIEISGSSREGTSVYIEFDISLLKRTDDV